jgi:hypothetical protein
MAISGIYNAGEYRIYSDGEELYRAGNSEYDSQVYLEPGSPGSVSLARMRSFCRNTAQQFADEREESLGQCVEAEFED